MMISAEWILTLAGLVLSILIFSLIFGDNGLFRFAGSILSGAIAAVLTLVLIEKVFFPFLVVPIADENADSGIRLASIITSALILILVFFYFRRSSRAAVQPFIGVLYFSLSAIALGGAVSGTLIPLVKMTVQSFAKSAVGTDSWRWAEAIFTLTGVVTALIYTRQLSAERGAAAGRTKPTSGGAILNFLERVGEIMVAIAFGAIFAGVFITSALILIDRLDILLNGGRVISEGLFK